MECPSSDRWTAFANGLGTQAGRAELTEHAASCTTCHGVLSSLAVAPTTVAQTANTIGNAHHNAVMLAPGTPVGRYVIESALGAGGMGVVYVAHDPELDRKVAIKLLRAGTPSERLRREAQALAKLDHANVVAVHDVGEHDGQSFVAMALVEGRDLRQWRAKAPPVREAIRVIIDAGRGVAAAHAAGLVHRDLKPDNIFVSDRGQVLVGDFGLARSANELDDQHAARQSGNISVTVTGAIVGTPAYMAPEQARGEPTVMSDQYALCVTAWETLYGARPFAGTTFDEILAASSAGKIVEPAHDPGVPKRVRRALERGMAADPAARWPSIDALLDELAGDRARRRRNIAFTAAGVAAVLGGAWGVTRLTPAAAARCRSSDQRLGEVWTPVRAAEIRVAIARAAPYALTSIDHAVEALDAYALHWRRSWDNTCRAEVSDAGFDLRVACLDQRLRSLALAVDALRGGDRVTARYVLDVATNLPELEHCDDLASLRKIAPPPAKLVERVAAVDRDVAAADTLAHAGKFRAADTILRRTQSEAAALGYAPTQARAELALGTVLVMQAHFTEAKPHFDAALNHAIAAGDDEVTARSYIALGKTAVALADAPRARELDATADAALRRIGDPPGLRAKQVVLNATLPALSGDYAETLVRVTRAIPQLEAAHFQREASALYRLHSALLGGLGRVDDAIAAYGHEIDATREMLGAQHPDYGDARIARGSFLLGHGRYTEAINDYAIGYAALLEALGPDDVMTIRAGAEIAGLDLLFGRYDAAIPKLRRAAESNEQQGGPEATASARRDLGQALLAAGRYDEADHELARAIELDGKIEGPYILADQLAVATLRFRQGRHAEAQAIIDRVSPALAKTLGADNPALADLWILQARVDIALGHPDHALTLLAKVAPGADALEAQVVLAQARDRQGDHAGAAVARKSAFEMLEKIGAGSRPDLRAELAPVH